MRLGPLGGGETDRLGLLFQEGAFFGGGGDGDRDLFIALLGGGGDGEREKERAGGAFTAPLEPPRTSAGGGDGLLPLGT